MQIDASSSARHFIIRPMLLWTAFLEFAERVRTTPLSMIAFQLASWFTYFLWVGVGAPSAVDAMGVVNWLMLEMLGTAPVPILLTFALRFYSGSATDAVRRPLRFLVTLALAACIAHFSMLALASVRGWIPAAVSGGFWWFHILTGVLNIMILGGTFSWLSLLYLRNVEDRAKLDAQLTKRSMLARQVAQSKLSAARAQIDPEMVARILRAVRARHHADAEQAFALLDHLISYLRLAMNRVRDQAPNLTSEFALIRSYLALREAETGVSVNAHMEFDAHALHWPDSPPPLFLVIRKILDALIESLPAAIVLCIAMQPKKLCLTLKTGAVSIAEYRLKSVEASLNELLNSNAHKMHHSFESGVNQYVVSIAAE